jgi:tetratricopeptide (TPR) repeat protein
MVPSMLAAVVLLVSAVLAFAESGAAEHGQVLLERATKAFLDQSLPAPELRGLLESSLQSLSGAAESRERDYWQARVEYLRGFVERGDRKDGEAERRFRDGYALSERAADAQGGDAYRLQADLIAQLIPFHGMWYAMRNGPRIRELAQKALDLDAANPKARLTLALFYLNAPAVAGGSDREALRILHELEARGDLGPEDRFGVLTWLGLTYRGRKDQDRARFYFERAREIYPGNTWVRSLAE